MPFSIPPGKQEKISLPAKGTQSGYHHKQENQHTLDTGSVVYEQEPHNMQIYNTCTRLKSNALNHERFI